MIEQTKTHHQEILDFVMSRQTQRFSFNSLINLSEERKWLIAVTCLEATNSVFKITEENYSFSLTIPGHWDYKYTENTINGLNKLLELKSQKGTELHVKEVRERRNQTKIGDNEYNSVFRYSKVFRLHAILHDAAGAVRSHSGKGTGYCYMTGRRPNSCLLGHVTGLFFCLYVKLFLPSIFKSVDF